MEINTRPVTGIKQINLPKMKNDAESLGNTL
jgi:hypothetical protein